MSEQQRIIRARALAWEALTGDEQADWLRQVDATFAELDAATRRPANPPSVSERTPLRSVTAAEPATRPDGR